MQTMEVKKNKMLYVNVNGMSYIVCEMWNVLYFWMISGSVKWVAKVSSQTKQKITLINLFDSFRKLFQYFTVGC